MRRHLDRYTVAQKHLEAGELVAVAFAKAAGVAEQVQLAIGTSACT